MKSSILGYEKKLAGTTIMKGLDRSTLLLAAAAGISFGAWMWLSNRKVKRKPRQVVFAVTGFGKFAGVEDNPTATLIKALPTWLRTHPLPKNATVDRCQILEVSGEGAKDGLAQMRETTFEQMDQMRVWIHLGVDAKSSKFKLEQSAYNEATFRVADERGWEPCEECIDGAMKKGSRLSTALPTRSLCARLKKLGFDVDVSHDPGRFVCNWLYFCSLKGCIDKIAAEKSSRGPEEEPCNEQAMFVHVPSFGVFDSDTQLNFVHGLLCNITETLVAS